MEEKIVDSAKASAFFRVLEKAEKIVFIGHYNPDGDCIGCLTAMRAWVEANYGRDGIMIVPGNFPDYLGFLPSADRILVFTRQASAANEAIKAADTIICLDFNTLSRTEALADIIRQSSARKVLIDHHPSPENFADVEISYTQVSSACELAWWVVQHKNGVMPDASMIAFYTGMMTDTNNFSNSVYPSTFRMAAQIAESGIDREKVQMGVLNSFSEQRMRLMGEMLLNNMYIVSVGEMRAGIMILDSATKEKYNYADGDSEGFVNLPLKIKGIEISALFTQGDGFIRVSLRSKGAISVNQLSRRFFNGGGHERASGGRIEIPVEEIKTYFEKSLRAFLET